MPSPHSVLAPIVDEPTVLAIRKLCREIYANSAAVHSPRGGGNNGHLALVMTPAAYLARAAVPYIDPLHAAGAIAPQITETNRCFAQDQFDHRLHTTVSQELRKQIIAAIESKYFAALYDCNFGLADVSAYLHFYSISMAPTPSSHLMILSAIASNSAPSSTPMTPLKIFGSVSIPARNMLTLPARPSRTPPSSA
jgi:hypothetical protein